MATVTKTPASSSSSPAKGSHKRGVSPSRLSRLQEKEELQHLNDRLAVYIDRMQFLEDQNKRLSIEVSTSRDIVSREVGDVKALYEKELEIARRLADQEAKDKARVQLENSKNESLAADYREKFENEEALRKKAEADLQILEKRLHEKEHRLSDLQEDKRDLERKLKELLDQVSELEAALEAARDSLQNETLTRVDLENQIQTLKEDMEFKRKVYEKELTQTRAQLTETSYTRIDQTDFRATYDSLLREKLDELREEFEEEFEEHRQEFEDAFSSKYEELKRQCSRDKEECGRLYASNRELKTSMEKYRNDCGLFESKALSLEKRVHELEHMRNMDKEKHAEELHRRDLKIRELEEEVSNLHREYADLMSVKVALDMEIAAYRKLLEGEEQRLNISPPQSPVDIVASRSRTRGAKRARVDESEVDIQVSTTEHNIQIVECDADGKYIKLHNPTPSDEPLNGWVVRRQVAGSDPVEFKFAGRSQLKGGASVTIWSASAGVKHKPPTDLVLKGNDWGFGTDVVTSVLNSDAKVVAQVTHQASTTVEVKESVSRRVRAKPVRRAAQRSGADPNRESCVIS